MLINYKKKKITKLLGRFNYISIRENQGQKMIKELINKDVPVVVDPTILLSASEWNQYIKNEPVYMGEYVFCYLLSDNKKYINNIKEFAKKKNLKVVINPTEKGPFNTGFEEMLDVGPAEWMNLIKNASYVFTDSFHGCIFSTIFNKEVFLYKRFSDNSKKSENSRVYTLTKWLGIEERLIDENSLDKIFAMNKINYENVEKNLFDKKKESSDWLLNVLKESENIVINNE